MSGPERVLVDDVIKTTLSMLELRAWSVLRLTVGEVKETDVWAALRERPLETEDRVVIVTNAHEVTNWLGLEKFLERKRKNPHMYLILVSEDKWLPRKEKEEGEHRAQVADHIALIRKHGKVVECKPFTQATAKDAVQWVQRRGNMTGHTAAFLLNRANGELRYVRDACTKLSILGRQATSSDVSAVLAPRPSETLPDALMGRNKKKALEALTTLPEDAVLDTLYDLSRQLDFVGVVHDMMSNRKTKTEIMAFAAEENKAHLVTYAMDVAKFYNPKRRLDVRRLLESAMLAHERGATKGVLESVIAVW